MRPASSPTQPVNKTKESPALCKHDLETERIARDTWLPPAEPLGLILLTSKLTYTSGQEYLDWAMWTICVCPKLWWFCASTCGWRYNTKKDRNGKWQLCSRAIWWTIILITYIYYLLLFEISRTWAQSSNLIFVEGFSVIAQSWNFSAIHMPPQLSD